MPQSPSPSIAHTAAAIIRRELEALKAEILAYPDEASLWATPSGISNSAGTLALHLAGNLSHFVGAMIGGTGYVRDRDAEFAIRNAPRTEILAKIDAAMAAVEMSLAPLSDAGLRSKAPYTFGELTIDADDFLIHLVSHLGYHLGQVDYHRRLTCGGPAVDALKMPKLHSARTKTGK